MLGVERSANGLEGRRNIQEQKPTRSDPGLLAW